MCVSLQTIVADKHREIYSAPQTIWINNESVGL